MRLFCFPYAGGSSIVYNSWKALLNPDIELFPIELSGRGGRAAEASYGSMKDVMEDVFRLIKNNLENEYALFGHSLGGAIVFSLAQEIMKRHLREPKHIFFSGKGAPGYKTGEKTKYHLMNPEEFEQAILKLGGTPREVFQHRQLKDFFIPLLMNDFKLAETWTWSDEIKIFNCDISAFFGKQENVSAEEVDGWKNYTKGTCSIQYFNGGHFFINEVTAQVVRHVNLKLAPCKTSCENV